MSRPSWDDFFLDQLPALAARATCDRGRAAAVFVRNREQVAAGYVGSPSGFPHCDDVGHLWDDSGRHCLRTVHAEQNALVRAARSGVRLRGATLYCTLEPCLTCAKLLVALDVARVHAAHPYHDSLLSRQVLAQAGVPLLLRSKDPLYVP